MFVHMSVKGCTHGCVAYTHVCSACVCEGVHTWMCGICMGMFVKVCRGLSSLSGVFPHYFYLLFCSDFEQGLSLNLMLTK